MLYVCCKEGHHVVVYPNYSVHALTVWHVSRVLFMLTSYAKHSFLWWENNLEFMAHLFTFLCSRMWGIYYSSESLLVSRVLLQQTWLDQNWDTLCVNFTHLHINRAGLSLMQFYCLTCLSSCWSVLVIFLLVLFMWVYQDEKQNHLMLYVLLFSHMFTHTHWQVSKSL